MGPRLLRRRLVRTLLWTLALHASPASSLAATDPAEPDTTENPRYRLQPVVVTGERIPVSLDRVPLDMTVLDRRRLDAERPLLLSEALRQVTGIDVQRSGSWGKLTDVRLRGADPRHTLVLFDGVPLNGPWLGTFDFADLGDAGIDRVEVLGGPASSLYGSGAVGGVIQLLSGSGEEAPEPRARATAEYGELETFRGAVDWSGRAGRFPLGVSATRLTSEGTTTRDGYRGWSGTLRAETPAGSLGRARLSGLATEGRKELPYDFIFDPADPTLSPFGSVRQVEDPNYDETDRMASGSVAWTRRLHPRAEIAADASGLYGAIHNDNRPSTLGGDFQDTKLRNRRGIAAVRARLAPERHVDLALGGEYRAEHVERHDHASFGGFPVETQLDRSIHARSIYAQGHLEWRERVLADAGIRVDDHSRYGSYGLPRIAIGYLWRGAGVKLRGGYGRAFTAPSLSDLYYPGYSADSLRPERSTTWEAGVDGGWLGGRLEAHATYHHTEFRDLIQSASFTAPGNVGRARIEGEEYSIAVVPDPRLTVRAGVAHLVAVKLTDPPTASSPDPDRRLAKRPAWRLTASAEARPARAVTLTGSWRWVDAVRDPFDFIDARGRVLRGDHPGYAALDLGASISLEPRVPVDLTLRVWNALDREYSEVKGFPAPRRSVTAGIMLRP